MTSHSNRGKKGRPSAAELEQQWHRVSEAGMRAERMRLELNAAVAHGVRESRFRDMQDCAVMLRGAGFEEAAGWLAAQEGMPPLVPREIHL